MPSLVVLEAAADWIAALANEQQKSVLRYMTLLEVRGVTLPFPYCSEIKGARCAMRELRIKAKGHQLRVLYAYDPTRSAVVILGGDKTGDDRFYEWAVPAADKLFAEYVSTLKEEKLQK